MNVWLDWRLWNFEEANVLEGKIYDTEEKEKKSSDGFRLVNWATRGQNVL